MWRPWFAALWAESAVVAGQQDAAERIERARRCAVGNPIALAIVDRSAALAAADRRPACRRGTAPPGGLPVSVGALARPRRRPGAARGEDELAAMGAVPDWRDRRERHAWAITATDTFIRLAGIGSAAPCRAGGPAGNHLSHSSFMPRSHRTHQG